MTLRSWIAFAALLVVLAISGFYASRYLTTKQLASAQVLVTPYTLTYETYAFKSDGSEDHLVARVTRARRSDGAIVLKEAAGVAALKHDAAGRKINFLDGSVVTLHDYVRLRIDWPRLPDQAVAQMKARVTNTKPDNCIRHGDVILGHESILGHDTMVLQHEMKFPDPPTEIKTKWIAPDLGCEELKFRYEKKNPDGSSTLMAESFPGSLTLNEPDLALFDLSPYESVLPSVANRKLAESLGLTWTDAMSKSGIEQDKQYLGKR